jgi:hypothetical protein
MTMAKQADEQHLEPLQAGFLYAALQRLVKPSE